MGKKSWASCIDIDTDLVNYGIHDKVQTFRQFLLADIMLVLTDTD